MNHPCDTYTEKCKDCWNARYNGAGCKAFDEWVEEAKKALEKADKYRWHDLRKNPEDLPKEGETVFVAWEKSSRILYDTMLFLVDNLSDNKPIFSMMGCWFSIIGSRKISDGQIVAWRYIEEFEEEENEIQKETSGS